MNGPGLHSDREAAKRERGPSRKKEDAQLLRLRGEYPSFSSGPLRWGETGVEGGRRFSTASISGERNRESEEIISQDKGRQQIEWKGWFGKGRGAKVRQLSSKSLTQSMLRADWLHWQGVKEKGIDQRETSKFFPVWLIFPRTEDF